MQSECVLCAVERVVMVGKLNVCCNRAWYYIVKDETHVYLFRILRFTINLIIQNVI